MSLDPSSSPSTILDAIRWGTARLAAQSIESPRLNSEILLGHILGLRRLDLYLKFDRPLAAAEVEAFSAVIERRLTGMPVQYITGTAECFSLTFSVVPAVLIPRPETEVVVERAISAIQPLIQEDDLDLFRQGQRRTVLDVGTGSGVIAICLARRFPTLTVYASDLSPEAIAVARQNAACHGVADRITFLTGSLFDPLAGLGLEGALDMIVSNPPYIRHEELERLPREVRDFEPRLALDGGEDGMAIHRRLVEGASAYLKPGGLLIMEMGEDQAAALGQVLTGQARFHGVTIHQDYNRRDRVVVARHVEEKTKRTRRHG